MQNNQQIQYTMTRPKFCHVMFGSLRWQTCGWKGPCREREPMWNWTPSFIWASTLSTGQMAFAMPRTGSPETCWIFGWRKRFPLVESLLTMLAKFWPKRILGSALLVFGTLRLWFACLVLIFLDLLFSFGILLHGFFSCSLVRRRPESMATSISTTQRPWSCRSWWRVALSLRSTLTNAANGATLEGRSPSSYLVNKDTGFTCFFAIC